MATVSITVKRSRVSSLVLRSIAAFAAIAGLSNPAAAESSRSRSTDEPVVQAALPQAELDALRPDDPRAQWYDCGCYDHPVKHFPYSIVIFKNEAGDLVTRPERREGALTFSPLAQRHGDRYCTLESKEECYGPFSHPCDFTDFRYGPTLAEYFPTCKSEEREPD